MKIHVSVKTATKENFRDDSSLGLKENREYQGNFISVSVGVFWCLDFVYGDALCTYAVKQRSIQVSHIVCSLLWFDTRCILISMLPFISLVLIVRFLLTPGTYWFCMQSFGWWNRKQKTHKIASRKFRCYLCCCNQKNLPTNWEGLIN